MHEFEVLVRNEWRRRLGPKAYRRAHPRGIVRALASIAEDSAAAKHRTRLEQEIVEVISDLRAEGAGRSEVRRELAKLVQGMRAVLRRADVDSEVAESFVAPARDAVEETLAYPSPGAR